MAASGESSLQDGTKSSLPATVALAARQTRRRLDRICAVTADHSHTWYSKLIVQGLLRQKPLKPSQDGRHIPLRIEHASPLVDERRGREFIPNTIRTSRYTPWDFIPKQLYFQFTRLANFYFLCVGIPQTLPGLSTTGSFTTILPLLFFVLLTILKEGYDDFKRSRLDAFENANIATVLGNPKPPEHPRSNSKRPLWQIWRKANEPGVSVVEEEVEEDSDDTYQWNKVQWRNIKVGDIIRLSRDEDVPADIVLLYATGEDGVAYIDTMALDGETNLKSKTPLPTFKECSSIAAIRSLDAEFVVEDPNPDLYSFDGKVLTDGKTMPLTSNEVVYRGCTLRNTKYAVGIVINTGEECKIRLNANQHPEAKKPALERVSNRIVVFLALYVIALTVGLSMAYFQWQREVETDQTYLAGETVLTKEVVIGYAIQFNNVIPLALYISLEIVKLGQMFMLDSDTEMYHAPTDTPAKCNTNTILENLGQVTHIFSDKTGTLTENEMKFRKMSIAGTAWLHDKDLEGETTPQDETTPLQGETPLRREPTRQSAKTGPRKSREVTRVVEEVEADEDSVASPVAITVTSPAFPRMSSQLHPRPSSQLNRRSSSQWRSTGRPDLVQPDVTTTDLLEYIRMRPASPFARKARDYILCMAICHTCLPEVRDGNVDFQAASPDELALVRAAMELGYLVASRSSRQITLNIDIGDGNARTETYEVLDVIEFSSARKRMSVVVRYPDGRIYAICKGADSTILPRLKLANLARQKAEEVRKSADREHEMIRRSEQLEPRNSFGGRPSLSISRKSMALQGQPGPSRMRPAIERSKSVEAPHMRNSDDRSRPSLGVRTHSLDISKALSPYSPMTAPIEDERFGFLSDPLINDEAEVFTRCFKHLDEFASEGLRTLLYARKFIPETEYKAWKRIYDDATTSLTNRQDKIEAAGELIEQSLDLVGATAIEDKLQDGVPETIEKLGRANIKIWMLTGDKRETAINIAHSARLCRPASDIFILDSTKDDLEGQMMSIIEELQTGCVHSVVVVDGHTLGVIEQKAALKELFYALVPTIDSVICCRASPAQKATIVQALRSLVRGALTLAIGDGANDLAMISAAHVGVGISGKEGLQAARVADYAIAQFRFLQRLLLVHGRWNYVRTAKFILATFWKEMFFYVPTAVYQRYNGYTGTSLYESTSLTVFNTLFTSLAVILPGIFEKDLEATTLLAVPELYVYGQRNSGLNAPKFVAWMMTGAAQGVCVWFAVWAGYGGTLSVVADDNLYALGSLAFTIGVVWINIKLLILETHDITNIILGGFAITFIGWWVWLIFLSVTELNPDAKLLYAMKDTFLHTFGADPAWWATVVSVVVSLIVVDVAFRTFKHKMIVAGAWKWPPWAKTAAGNNAEEFHVEVWQNLEKDPVMQGRMRRTLEAEKGLSEEERAKVILEEEQANIILEQEGVAMERLR